MLKTNTASMLGCMKLECKGHISILRKGGVERSFQYSPPKRDQYLTIQYFLVNVYDKRLGCTIPVGY
jgi:hypothetical protein